MNHLFQTHQGEQTIIGTLQITTADHEARVGIHFNRTIAIDLSKEENQDVGIAIK